MAECEMIPDEAAKLLDETIGFAHANALADKDIHSAWHAHERNCQRVKAALLVLPAPEGWRPIETAPKNATEIELKIPKKTHPGFYCVIAHWADGRQL